MSYASIWKPVNDRIIQASRETRNEIIGLLLGRLEDNTIIIEDSITGDFSSEPHRVTLPAPTLAKIADGIVRGKIKGSIVGWYHSHTEGGVFFSETDVRTQLNLQQFSQFIVGIVVDAQTGETGFFRVDPQTGKTIRMPEDHVRVYAEPSEAVAPEAKERALVRATPTIEVRPRPAQTKRRIGLIVAAIVVIILVASFAILGSVILLQPPRGTPEIILSPIANATVGTPLRIVANVTNTLHNITLHYASAGSTEFTQTEMTPANGGLYTYTIPGEQITGSLTYYVTAQDAAGNSIQTKTYIVQIADFSLAPSNQLVVLYRTRAFATQFSIIAMHGFSNTVTLTAAPPQGVSAGFSPNPISPGTSAQLNLTASANAANGTFPVDVVATYSPRDAPPVTRKATIMITITDFELTVSPGSKQVTPGNTATYSVELTILQGFTDKVAVTASGVPTGATSQVSAAGNVVAAGPGTSTLTLQVTTTGSVKAGTYNIVVTATGDGVTHTQTIQLIVR